VRLRRRPKESDGLAGDFAGTDHLRLRSSYSWHTFLTSLEQQNGTSERQIDRAFMNARRARERAEGSSERVKRRSPLQE